MEKLRLNNKKILFVVLMVFAVVLIALIIRREFKVKVAIVGDILLSRDVAGAINKNGFEYPYEKTKYLLKKSDIVLGNLEGPVTTVGYPAFKNRNLIFKANPMYLPALYAAGINILSLANNHTMDYGSEGMEATLECLAANGIQAVGGGINQEAAHKPIYINKRGVIIGIMSFSTFPAEGHFFLRDKADIAYIDEEKIGAEIKAAKEKCNYLIVAFHWGKEYSFLPSENQKRLAHLVADNGADIVVGQHPHVLQGIEKYKKAYIFYSLGSFVFDNPIREGTTDSIVLTFDISKSSIKNIELLPIKLKDCQPYLCKRDDAIRILKSINTYSKFFNEQIEIKNCKGLLRRD